jgi:hypothetical protein
MKKLVIALALASLVASPALAKKYHKQVTTDASDQVADQGYAGNQAYAYAPGYNGSVGTSYPNPVYAYGQYQGADPDPNIRLQLLRDPPNLQ